MALCSIDVTDGICGRDFALIKSSLVTRGMGTVPTGQGSLDPNCTDFAVGEDLPKPVKFNFGST